MSGDIIIKYQSATQVAKEHLRYISVLVMQFLYFLIIDKDLE